MAHATLDCTAPPPGSSRVRATSVDYDYACLVCGAGLPVDGRGPMPTSCRRYARHLQSPCARSGSDRDLEQLVRGDLAQTAEENLQRKLYGHSQDSATNPSTAGEND